ncbi:MAG: ASCH domain-containing protein [Streptosporangiaceae bacterium]
MPWPPRTCRPSNSPSPGRNGTAGWPPSWREIKTALTGPLQIFEQAGDSVPQPGQRFAVLDSAVQPAAVIELTEVRVIPVSMVDDDYARAEGRGYADATEWRRAHEDFLPSEGVAAFLAARR